MKIITDPNNEATIRKIGHIARDFRTGIYKANIDIGESHTKELKRQFSAPKHGRIYKKLHRGRFIQHRASRPGEALAILFGALFRSVEYKVHGWDSLTVQYGASSSDGFPYGKYWEELAPNAIKRESLRITVRIEERNTELYYCLRIGEELQC